MRRPVSIFTLLFLGMTWIWSAGTSRGEEDRTAESLFKGPAPWEISARSLTYDADGQTIVAQGDVVISREGQFLYAQEALYNRETGVAEVRGDVRLEIGEDVLTGRAATFDLNTQTGEVIDGRLFIRENHYYIDADRVEKLPGDSYLLDNARVTTCDGETPDWSITGSRVEVTLEGYGTIRNAAFRIRQVPFLYVPYLIFPAKRERQTGVLPPSFSYSSLSGAEIEVPFFWAVSHWTDATFYQRYLAERGYMQGLEYRYVAEENSKGIFLFDILSDSKRKDLTEPDDVRISPFERTNRTRYWFRGMGDQSLPYGIDARLTADYVSDQDYLREFQKGMIGFEARPDLPLEFGRPVDERRAPLRRSALRLSRDGAGYSLQGLAAYYQRPEDPDPDETPQPIVGVNYSLLPGQVSELPMFVSLDSEFDTIWREVGTKGQRLSLSPAARFPLLQGPYLELEPSLRYFLTAQRFENETGRDFEDKHAYEANVRMLTNLQRVYELDWRNAKRVMHRIWPKLTYTYRNTVDEEESPWFEPIEAEGRLHQIAFSLENFLTARLENGDGSVYYRQWATLDISQPYNISRRELATGEEQRPFDPLRVTMSVNPYRDLNFLGSARWDHYEQEVTAADLSLDLRVKRAGGRSDLYTLDYLFRKDRHEALALLANIHVAHGFSVGTSYRKDFFLDESISSRYWVDYQSQCWGVRVGVEIEEEETRGIFMVRLLGLGKW